MGFIATKTFLFCSESPREDRPAFAKLRRGRPALGRPRGLRRGRRRRQTRRPATFSGAIPTKSMAGPYSTRRPLAQILALPTSLSSSRKILIEKVEISLALVFFCRSEEHTS